MALAVTDTSRPNVACVTDSSDDADPESPVNASKRCKIDCPVNTCTQEVGSAVDTVDAFTKTLNFLDVSQLAQLLRSTPDGDVRPSVPNGPKNNVRFVVRLAVNTDTNRATHYDDCGVWDSGKGSTTATTYLLSGDRLKYVSKRGEQYCTGGRNNKWIPVDPQVQPRPHKVVTSHRYYATLKGSNFKKRVAWFTNLPDCDRKSGG